MNLRLCVTTLAVALLVASCSLHSALALDLVKDGKPSATIVIAEDAGNYQKWTAQWLQDYLKRATGAQLPVVTEAQIPTGTVISVGHTKLAKAAGISAEDLKYDGCKLLVKGNILFLIGRDDVPLWDKYPSPRESGAQGTIRAVTMFLEEIVGVRWFIPTPEGTVVPSAREIAVPDAFDRTFIPAMAYGSAGYLDPVSCYVNNSRVAMKILHYGGHSWEVDVGAAEYFADHPEYFRLDETGKRSAWGNHLCTSNPEVRKIIVEKMRKKFDSGYDVIELGASDGYQACLCAECMKLDSHRDGYTVTRANPSKKVWDMHLWIINELQKSHPDKKVMVILYGPSYWPPKNLDRLPDNCLGELAPISLAVLDAWQGKVQGLTGYLYWWDEDTNFTAFVPAVSPEWLQTTLREYRSHEIMGLVCGPTRNWGMGGPTFYSYAKLLGDPDVDLNKLLDEYCIGIYGPEAGPTMKRFFKLFHSRSGSQYAFRQSIRYPSPYYAEDTFLALYPPLIVRQMDGLLSHAEKIVQGERQKEWLKHTRDSFEGLATLANMFSAKRAFELNPTRDSLLQVKARVDAFEDWRARIIAYHDRKDYLDRFFPYYHMLCVGLLTNGDRGKYNELYYSSKATSDELADYASGKKTARGLAISAASGTINTPITWDFDRMLAAIGKPAQVYSATVRFTAKPPTMDGSVPPAEWKDCAPLAFERYQAPGSAIPDGATTTARLMYDAKNLYVAYECREPNIDRLKLKSVGRDGNVYEQDEVELFLNPEQSDRKFIHLMAAPIANAFYDERQGYITDELHPNYGRPEVTWNADWRYVFNIDRQKKVWTLVMAVPFKSLGVAAPAPGTVWTGNFGRVRRAGATEDISCWVPDTLGSSPDLFGEIQFTDAKGSVGPSHAPKAGQTAPPLSEQSAAELVKNASFESVDQEGKIASWTIASFPSGRDMTIPSCCGISEDKAHSGKQSLKLDFRDVDFAGEGSFDQILMHQDLSREEVESVRGKTLVLTAWINYDYIAEDAVDHYFPGPLFGVRTADAQGKLTMPLSIILNRDSMPSFGLGSPTALIGKWVKVETRGTIPEDAQSVEIRIEHVGRGGRSTEANNTSVFVDDIRLEPAT